jgi:deoxyribodipyrimidine photo-lyase
VSPDSTAAHTVNWENDFRIFSSESTVFWFRRDLRLTDNAGLFHALKNSKSVIPVFIFDSEILEKLDDKSDSRVAFILQSLDVLKHDLEKNGTSLSILYGDPVELYKRINVASVYTNEDYEPYARQRDSAISNILTERGSSFQSFKDQVIFGPDEVLKDDGSPYTVFTPYSRKWLVKLNKFFLKSYPTENYFSNFVSTPPLPFPTLEAIGFYQTRIPLPQRVIRQSVIENYDKTRNFPAIEGTTRIGVHLRFGTVSIRKLAVIAAAQNQTFLKEVIWREFYQMILWHYPHVENKSFKPAYDRIQWRNNPEEFEAWCKGQTGYPIVDAGMRELNETGYMHNRVRMVVASFLTKHLLIDWRWGEAYFAKKLLDYDLASNNGGWQWAAGTGCDAAPYFRVFNPALQTQKFDKSLEYIRRWVPEFDTTSYARPIVEHAFARVRALSAYGEGLA